MDFNLSNWKTNPKNMKNLCSFLLSGLLIVFGITSCSSGPEKPQPVLGARSAKILEKRGLKFKDLNKNGKVDKYEDWRLTPDERSKDLLSKMSVEEKVGYMLINSANMVGKNRAEASENKLAASDLDEGGGRQQNPGGGGGFGINRSRPGQDTARRTRPGTGGANGERIANMNRGAGTTKVVKEFHNRHFILRSNESVRITAEWANKLQTLCESEPLGIPAIIASNPRNNITTNASLGTSVGTTVFTSWPGELGLSAMRDLSLLHEFADDSRQEWLAVGLRKGYMYQADLSTEPRWSRINGTFGENAEWVAKITKEIVLGFQGEKLSPTSVALTTKHFPGGGSGQGGQDSHFDWGKKEVYPGGMFKNNMIPFQAAIDAGTSSIMPYYSLPSGTEFEEVGFSYNKKVINDILRKQMGFKGIINSDTGPIDNMPWGVENLTIPERYKKALEAGVNLFSGISDPTILLDVVKSGKVDMSLIDSSVVRLLNEKFAMGIFENPYADLDAAEKIVNNEKFRESASIALRKSIVLLRDEKKALPVPAKTKVYFESLQKSGRDPKPGSPIVFSDPDKKYPVEFVKTPAEADMVIFWVIPTGNSLFGSTGEPISISLSKCAVDVAYINKISAKKPTVLVINYSNPWVIDEIYNEKTQKNIVGVLATFGTTTDAVLDVITGKFNPTGKMPFSTPVSDEAVTNQKEDVPGYMEPAGYALFNYDEGISYPE
jgi:beta-glucosidase